MVLGCFMLVRWVVFLMILNWVFGIVLVIVWLCSGGVVGLLVSVIMSVGVLMCVSWLVRFMLWIVL